MIFREMITRNIRDDYFAHSLLPPVFCPRLIRNILSFKSLPSAQSTARLGCIIHPRYGLSTQTPPWYRLSTQPSPRPRRKGIERDTSLTMLPAHISLSTPKPPGTLAATRAPGVHPLGAQGIRARKALGTCYACWLTQLKCVFTRVWWTLVSWP